ncbi:hypothetical protein M758_12G191600 [Ceratodon purpureus]|nr:hypothetical protein M758_12G191600 [Ceratodon purpureus]
MAITYLGLACACCKILYSLSIACQIANATDDQHHMGGEIDCRSAT